MSAIAQKDGLVTYVRSPVEHETGVNFLVSDTAHPAILFAQVYGSCGFRNLPNRSLVIVKNQGPHDNLEGCFYTSSLIHLGFYVDKTISAQIDQNPSTSSSRITLVRNQRRDAEPKDSH